MPTASQAPVPSPIARRNVYELVTESLAAHIEASLEPGDPLPAERILATTYGVGRSSIREAMRMLESRGLIESRGNGSFAVAQWRNPFDRSLAVFLTGSQSDRDHLFEVRRVLEGEAAALAAARRTDEHVAELAEAIGAMDAHVGSIADYTEADLRF